MVQTFGGNIWPSNYCWSHHKVGHFCPKMRLKETGKNLGRIWQMKSHLQARFSIEIHFYFQTLRLNCSTFCLLLFEQGEKNLPAFSVTHSRFQNNELFFFKKSLAKLFNLLWYVLYKRFYYPFKTWNIFLMFFLTIFCIKTTKNLYKKIANMATKYQNQFRYRRKPLNLMFPEISNIFKICHFQYSSFHIFFH